MPNPKPFRSAQRGAAVGCRLRSRPLRARRGEGSITLDPIDDVPRARADCERPHECAGAAPNPQAGADRLEAAADQAIAACGGNVRDALKALIVANEFLESEVCELMQAVSHAYARGRFKTYSGY